ncbi:MAG TPA: hypothetical protein VHM91_11600 [Verrucomicrobiales bacterium]|nr:hypothetical protein [Verrucomicrobiales bacterium]
MTPRKTICLLSFSPVAKDGRVLRHLKFLGEHYDLIAIGYGEDPSPFLPGVRLTWHEVKAPPGGKFRKLYRTLMRWPGRVIPSLDWVPDTMMPDWKEAQAILRGLDYDLFFGNDISALLLAVWQHRTKGKPFFMDYHEFAPLEASEKAWHRWFHGPHGGRLLKRYGRLAAGSSTVNPMFTERFERDFGFPSVSVMNAPVLIDLPPAAPRVDDRIHLVFHGAPQGDRNLDVLIRAMPLLDNRFVLHLLLSSGAEDGSLYRRLAAAAPPGRIVFEENVRPAGMVARLTGWDIGFNILTPLNYNHNHALPNKFFDYIHAGLASVCSNTVTASDFVSRYGIGWVLDAITPECIAALLLSLTPEDIAVRKAAALRLREQIHARAEEAHLVSLVQKILPAA